MFSIILSPSNIIQSWTDIKQELRLFTRSHFFNCQQIEKMQVINVKNKFQDWFRKTFANIELNYASFDNWQLDAAFAFIFQQNFDTTLSKSIDWNIGLFLQLNPGGIERLRCKCITSLPPPNRYRTELSDYAIDESIAIRRIVAVFQNSFTLKHAENYLKKYYNILSRDNTFSTSTGNIN